MKDIKIFFCDFWNGGEYNTIDNPFSWLLREAGYNPIIDPNPELLIYSVFGNQHHNFNCKKLFYTGENIRPNFRECNFALTFDFMSDPRQCRFPFYSLTRWPWFNDWKESETYKPIPYDRILQPKNELMDEVVHRKFCCFIQSNPNCAPRNNFYWKLSAYKHIDAAGPLFNNTNFIIPWNQEKLNYRKDYKFVIAFENSSYPGYVSEKILEPMVMKTIPIYWGSPVIEKDFNTASFINAHQYNSLDEVVERVKELDQDDEKYYEMYKQSYLTDNKMTKYMEYETIIEFLKNTVLV